MSQRQTLPVLPLRGTVIFPGITAPIAAGRPGTLRAIETALKGDRLVFAVAPRDNTQEPPPNILFPTAPPPARQPRRPPLRHPLPPGLHGGAGPDPARPRWCPAAAPGGAARHGTP